MSNDDTFIEQPAPPPQPPQRGPTSPPPMPPPPGPPVRKGRANILVIGIVVVILFLCAVASFGVWRLYQGGTFSFGESSGDGLDAVQLTQTALVDSVQEIEILTDTPAPLPTDTLQPTNPPAPTDTAAPTNPPTNTTVPTSTAPIFTASQGGFCRLGPSTIYKDVRTMAAGDKQPILGQSISPVDGISVWWEVEINGARCFISSGLGTTTGDTSSVPLLVAPPTPSPTPTNTPTATPTATP